MAYYCVADTIFLYFCFGYVGIPILYMCISLLHHLFFIKMHKKPTISVGVLLRRRLHIFIIHYTLYVFFPTTPLFQKTHFIPTIYLHTLPIYYLSSHITIYRSYLHFIIHSSLRLLLLYTHYTSSFYIFFSIRLN